MPQVLKAIAYCDPLTHFLPLLRNILLKGGDPSFVAFHVGVLVLMGIILSLFSFKLVQTTLAK